MGLSDRLRLPSDGLPNRYVIQLPSMILLFSEADLIATGVTGYTGLVDLRPGLVFNAKTSNQQLLGLYAELINEGGAGDTTPSDRHEPLDSLRRCPRPNALLYETDLPNSPDRQATSGLAEGKLQRGGEPRRIGHTAPYSM